jgi:hypothetical protein
MNFLTLFYFSWVFYYNKNIINKEAYSNKAVDLLQTSNKYQNITDGTDNIKIEKEEETIDMLSKIMKYKYNLDKLQILQNSHISIMQKLLIIEIIEKDTIDSIYSSNIHNGGLWKDWE